MSFAHPDDEHRQDAIDEAEFYALLDAETLEPLTPARCVFGLIGDKTRQVVRAEQVYGVNHPDVVFERARARREAAVARTMRRAM